MLKFLAPGVVAGALTAAAGIANALGYPVAGAVLADPVTATNATLVITAVGALVAGVLPHVRKPAA